MSKKSGVRRRAPPSSRRSRAVRAAAGHPPACLGGGEDHRLPLRVAARPKVEGCLHTLARLGGCSRRLARHPPARLRGQAGLAQGLHPPLTAARRRPPCAVGTEIAAVRLGWAARPTRHATHYSNTFWAGLLQSNRNSLRCMKHIGIYVYIYIYIYENMRLYVYNIFYPMIGLK